ncbi:hypothetical protein V5740_09620 [Croceibacterium sp. TMG7-5b_MA50]|uniref:hypothetical protein n=1 Tax=Croceibacterium sp. TMG7-5b_MA50 TaxID=3121290 RepID=UPI00322185EF
MKHLALATLPLLLAACGGEAPVPDDNPMEEAAHSDPLAIPVTLPPQVADFPALSSRTCIDVVRFYGEALAAGQFAGAALAWADPVIDGERLRSLLAGYERPSFTWGQPGEEGAAGSLYCTVPGTLTDAADGAKPPVTGEIVLRRVNDVDGATPEQLRWTIRSSTFVEPLERSARS